MALEINELKLPITPQQALDIIKYHTSKMGVFMDLDRIYELHGMLSMENKELRKKLRSITEKPSLNVDNTDEVCQALINMGVYRRDLTVDKKFSLSKATYNNVLTNEDYDDEIYEAVKTYMKYSSNKTRIGTFKGYEKLPQSVELSFNNHRMVLARPDWRLLSTSRLQAFDPGIQGVARDYGDIITYPKGYILVRADSSQIEPRINWSYFLRDEVIIRLINAHADAYFGLLDYCLLNEHIFNELYKDSNYEYNILQISDELKDKRQMLKTLTNAGSYGSQHLGNIDPGLAAAFEKRIVNHPKRLALEREVSEICMNDENPVFYSAFGTPIAPDETAKYSKDSKAWKGHIERCGINNPVQATASDLMICSMNAAHNLIGHFKDSAICYYKHDEGAFLLSEKDVEGTDIVEQLSDITAYNVKGWIPIPADPIIGVKKPTLPSYL